MAFTYNTGNTQAERWPGRSATWAARYWTIRADLADVTRRRRYDAAMRQLGPVDILVNNAGVTFWRPDGDTRWTRLRPMVAVDVPARS